MEAFLGKFNRVSEEGYENFLTALNLNYMLRSDDHDYDDIPDDPDPDHDNYDKSFQGFFQESSHCVLTYFGDSQGKFHDTCEDCDR